MLLQDMNLELSLADLVESHVHVVSMDPV